MPTYARPGLCLLLSLGLTLSAHAEGIRFSRITVSGNRAIASPSIDKVTADYLNRELGDEDLQRLRQALDALYAAQGFRSSRARLPDQRLDTGVLRIEMIEASLEEIILSGNAHLNANYLRARVGRGLDKPLNVNRLNDNLRLLLRERVVDDLKAEFLPGSARDRQRLKLSLTEGPQYSVGMRVGNDRSPSVGGIHGVVEAGARNLLGRGDTLDLSSGHADGLGDWDLRWRLPLNAGGTELTARYARYDSTLVEEQFVVLGAETESNAFELGLNQPLIRSANRQVALSARFSHRDSQSYLLGKPYSFSAEADDGRVDVDALRLGVQWTEAQPGDVLALRAGVSVGIGGTEHPDDIPDARFTSVQLLGQWLHVFGPRAGQFFARADLQLASEPLVSLERYALGGVGTVRGYRRARVVSDSGWSASLEYRLPLWRLAFPGTGSEDGQILLVAFLDAGEGWSDRPGVKTSPTLAALGPGLRYDINPRIRAEIYWGALRRRVPETEPDLQDSGVHFQVAAQFGF